MSISGESVGVGSGVGVGVGSTVGVGVGVGVGFSVGVGVGVGFSSGLVGGTITVFAAVVKVCTVAVEVPTALVAVTATVYLVE